MATGAIWMGIWIYRNGPQDNRVMLRYWVLAFALLFLGGITGAILESVGESLSYSERMVTRLGLGALYMGAGLMQLFGILESSHPKSWGKDLILGMSGAAYLITVVLSSLYKFPDIKMYFLTFSTSLALLALLIGSKERIPGREILLLGALLQLTGISIYFAQLSLGPVSHSILFNLLMFAGMLCYLRGLSRTVVPVTASDQLTNEGT